MASCHDEGPEQNGRDRQGDGQQHTGYDEPTDDDKSGGEQAEHESTSSGGATSSGTGSTRYRPTGGRRTWGCWTADVEHRSGLRVRDACGPSRRCSGAVGVGLGRSR